MEVRVERFDDRSDPDEHGCYEYVYIGASLHFSHGGESLTLRLYDDEAGMATVVSPPGWRPDLYSGPLFREAVVYLRDRHAVSTIRVDHPGGRGFRPLGEAADAARRLDLAVPSDDIIRDLEAAT